MELDSSKKCGKFTQDMKPVILIGPNAKHLIDDNESAKAGLTSATVDCKRFPGGESYCQIKDNIRGADVYIVQSISAPANETLMDLLVMADAARRASAGRLTALVPYMGYMRQDRKDKPRVPITAKMVIDMLGCAGFNRIITMDVHTLQAQGFTNLPFDHLFSFPIIAKHLQATMSLNKTVIVAPDIGAIKRASAYAEAFKTSFAIVNKKRLSPDEVSAESLIGNVSGKDVVIVDDLTESCNTLIEAAKICRAKGAKSVAAAVTHACLHEQGINNLDAAFNAGIFDKFITTNTVNTFKVGDSGKLCVLPVNDMLYDVIGRTNRNESITELFDVKGF